MLQIASQIVPNSNFCYSWLFFGLIILAQGQHFTKKLAREEFYGKKMEF